MDFEYLGKRRNKFIDLQSLKDLYETKIKTVNELKTLKTAVNLPKFDSRNNYKLLLECSRNTNKTLQEILRIYRAEEFILENKINKELKELNNEKQRLNRRKRTRRFDVEIDKHYHVNIYINLLMKCIFKNCDKSYGSEISMNHHMRKAHKCGTKNQRIQFYGDFFDNWIKDYKPPVPKFNTPYKLIEVI